MVDSQGLYIIDSEIEIPKTGFELIGDIPSLTLVDNTCFRAVIGASVMGAGDGEVGYEYVIV